jgi:peroxiredoxin
MSPAKIALLATLGLCFAGGCSRSAPPTPAKAELADAPRPTTAAMTAAPTPPAAPLANARVGAPAPDFELPDLDGKQVKLSSFLGKTVVLEWFNPGCPFVNASHTKGGLVDTAARHVKEGVVWLAINSGAPGKQGNGVDANRAGKQKFKLEHPILLDESGTVGRAYGAAHTPHMFVIDSKGVLVYRGAIDNSPDAEGESPTGGKLVNFVDAALADLKAGQPVTTAETEAYGCSVKYQM